MKKILLIVLLAWSGFVHASLQASLPQQHIANAPLSITTTTTSTTIIAANVSRAGLDCTNTGTATVNLAFGANAAVAGAGLAITAGATWWTDDYSFTTQSVQAIGASTLSCQEWQ